MNSCSLLIHRRISHFMDYKISSYGFLGLVVILTVASLLKGRFWLRFDVIIPVNFFLAAYFLVGYFCLGFIVMLLVTYLLCTYLVVFQFRAPLPQPSFHPFCFGCADSFKIMCNSRDKIYIKKFFPSFPKLL